MTARIIHGDPDDLLYVNEAMRRCATCEKAKSLDSFQYRTLGSGEQTQVRVCVDCKACIKESRELAKAERSQGGADLLAQALSSATRRRTLLEASPRSSDGIRAVIEFLGGEDKAYRLVGRSLKRAMRAENVEVARKGAATFIDFLLRAEKAGGEPIDLSELTDEDRLMILMEPAKQLLMSSREMRESLLNDPEVRSKILGEAGVKVLTIEKEPANG